MGITAGHRLGPKPQTSGPVANKQDSHLAHVAHAGPNTLGHPLTCGYAPWPTQWARFLAQHTITPPLTCGYVFGPHGPPYGGGGSVGHPTTTAGVRSPT